MFTGKRAPASAVVSMHAHQILTGSRLGPACGGGWCAAVTGGNLLPGPAGALQALDARGAALSGPQQHGNRDGQNGQQRGQ